MRHLLLTAVTLALGCSASCSPAAPPAPDRMLAAPTPMFMEWQTRFNIPQPDFQSLRTFAGLPPLLEFYDGRPVRTAEQWLDRKAELRRLLCEYFLGSPPKQIPQCKRAKVLAETRDGVSVSRLVELAFATTPEVSITIEILSPEGRGAVSRAVHADQSSPLGPDRTLARVHGVHLSRRGHRRPVGQVPFRVSRVRLGSSAAPCLDSQPRAGLRAHVAGGSIGSVWRSPATRATESSR